MFALGITALALVFGQVVAYPPYFTLDDNGAGDYPPDYTLNIEDEAAEHISDIEPFEITNPTQVDGRELHESDMLLSDEQWDSLRTRKAKRNEKYRWTEGLNGNPRVPYLFQDSVNQDLVRDGLDHWMEHTCIEFEETSNIEQPHIKFKIDKGCYSRVGMSFWMQNSTGHYDVNGKYYGQPISIGSGCNSIGTVVHEVGHAIGFYHEQSRSDRDRYITVVEKNINGSRIGQFNKAKHDNNYGVKYDYSSNMQYGMNFWTNNSLPTMVTIEPMDQELIAIGHRKGLSHRDKLMANRMYNCIEKWVNKCRMPSDRCLNDGYTGKYCKCVCPPGTTGSTCEIVLNDDYYAPVRNPLSEKISTEKTLKVETPMKRRTSFVKWIKPPKCQKAKVTFTNADLGYYCNDQYLNVRTNSSDISGRRMCAADVTAGVTLISEEEIIITMVNFYNYNRKMTLWAADVTFEKIPGCSCTGHQTG